MASKSIQLKNNTYLDTKGSTHKQVSLYTVLNKIDDDISAINASSIIVGGYNMLHNSNMKNDSTGWSLDGTGSYSTGNDSTATKYGAVTGDVFALSELSASQTVDVKVDVDGLDEAYKTYYSFSILVKKGSGSTGKIRLYNGTDIHYLDIDSSSQDYTRYSLERILPSKNTLTVELSSISGSIVFADAMLSMSKTKTNWMQAGDEFINDMAVLSDSEFVTKQIEVTKKIDMQNLRLVATDTSGFKGWSLVRGDE